MARYTRARYTRARYTREKDLHITVSADVLMEVFCQFIRAVLSLFQVIGSRHNYNVGIIIISSSVGRFFIFGMNLVSPGKAAPIIII